jgi:hypothetical protein
MSTIQKFEYYCATSPKVKWTKEYNGFESIEDLLSAEDIEEAIIAIVPSGEWQGRIRVTLEYFPDEKEDKEV